MKISIRYKLLAYMLVSVMIFSLLLFAFSAFFIENYYTNYKKDFLIKTSEYIIKNLYNEEKELKSIDEDLYDDINQLEKDIGCTIILRSENEKIYYPKNKNFMPKRLNNQKLSNKDSFFNTREDNRLKINLLTYNKILPNKDELSISMPMTSITDSINIYNKFMVIIGIITIVITIIWSLFISKKFTKPITEINEKTKKMSKLNFNHEIYLETNDEFSELAQNINFLSLKLNNTLSQLKEKNNELYKDINQKNKIEQLRKEFISNVSHELKTPIFLIQGYAEGLKNNIANDNKRKDFYCDVIIEEIDKMDMLVKDLLDLSQMQSDNLMIEKSEFDIIYLCNDIVDKFRHIFNNNSIDIKIISSKSLTAIGDKKRIEQVIVNYLNNAVNHVKNIPNTNKKEIIIEIYIKDNRGYLSIYNSGSQIPEECLDKIWTSFYRVDKARTREYGGTGLGLTIAKGILDMHNNKYGVININDGVKFWFDFENG